jgi:signal transduction histidine kinase
MELGGKPSIRQTAAKARFWILALPVLAVGWFGMRQVWVKPGLPFTWEASGRALVLARVLPSVQGLAPGDTLISIGGFAVPHDHDVEFAMDEHRRGDTLIVAVRHAGREASVPVVAGAWYSMTLVAVNLLFGLMLWAIGVFVLWKKHDEKPARVLFYFTQCLASVTFITNAQFPSGTRPWNLLLPNLYYLAYAFFPALLLHFSLIFPNEKYWLQKRPRVKALLYVPILFLAPLVLFTHTRAVLTKLHRDYHTYYMVFNGLRGYNLLYFTLSLVSLVFSLARARLKSDKNKVRWILWGFAVGSFPFMALWTVPFILGFRPLVPEEVTDVALFVAPISLAIAIVRYQVFDIEVLINRSLVYAFLTALIAGMYLILVGLTGNLVLLKNPHANAFFVIAFTTLAAVFFNPAKQRIQTWVDKTFYRLKFNARAATHGLQQRLAAAVSAGDVCEHLVETVSRTLHVRKIAVLLFREDGPAADCARGFSNSEKEALKILSSAAPLREAGEAGRLIAERGLMDPASIASLLTTPALRMEGVWLLVSIGPPESRIGALALGEKLSGVRFLEDDLDLVAALLHETFLALQRIRLQEAALQEKNRSEHLEKLNQLKSDFVSHVSHELRTPLASMITGVRNLLDGIPENPSDGVKGYLKGVHDSGKYLNRMILNLLDTAKIEADKLELNLERVSLEDMAARTIETLAPFAAEKSITLATGSFSGLCVLADADALFQVFSNLVENAVKYSPNGQTVRMSAEKTRPAPNGGDFAAVSVEDHGIGIPEDRLEFVFDRFERVTGGDRPRQKGLGLGLYIAKKLVEAQGGTLSVKSKPGRGSTFTFALPSCP